MKRRQPHSRDRSQRFEEYLEHLTRCAGHADRMVPMENYTKGLLLPLERKSVEPMAARLAPGSVRRMHQSLHHIVADAAWSDVALLRQVREQVLPAMTRRHKLIAWVVDDTGFPKKGNHSVGGGAAVLWPGRQTGELPDRGQRVAGYRAGQPPGGSHPRSRRARHGVPPPAGPPPPAGRSVSRRGRRRALLRRPAATRRTAR